MLRLPERPLLDWDQVFNFPDPESADEDGIVAVFGNLSPGFLISGYSQGLFPWYGPNEPIFWHSPDPRFVVFPEKVIVKKSMKKFLDKTSFRVTCDHAFIKVVENCSKVKRPHQKGTWIVREMIEAYLRLHSLGFAHSFETWDGNRLVGGLYGVSIGAMFFGESMFHLESNASKTAFITMVPWLINRGIQLIDSQVYTEHVSSLGGEEIPRRTYLKLLHEYICQPASELEWVAELDYTQENEK